MALNCRMPVSNELEMRQNEADLAYLTFLALWMKFRLLRSGHVCC